MTKYGQRRYFYWMENVLSVTALYTGNRRRHIYHAMPRFIHKVLESSAYFCDVHPVYCMQLGSDWQQFCFFILIFWLFVCIISHITCTVTVMYVNLSSYNISDFQTGGSSSVGESPATSKVGDLRIEQCRDLAQLIKSFTNSRKWH